MKEKFIVWEPTPRHTIRVAWGIWNGVMKRFVSFEEELIASIPSLRAFATALVRRRDLVDDLVQDTLLRAWSNQDLFTLGTNLRAWAFTILRNRFLTLYRSCKKEVGIEIDLIDSRNIQRPEQFAVLALSDFREALERLPTGQREALVLTAALGYSREEAAEICKVPTATIKSRVSRARHALKEFALDDAEFVFTSIPEHISHQALHLH